MSGARLVLTLALELRRRGGGLGAAALCGGGGQGDALIIRVPAAVSDRPAVVATSHGLVDGGPRQGDPRAVARLVTLVEDGDPSLPRGRRGAGPVHRPGPGRSG